MIDPAVGVPEVGADEKLARYILQSSHVRRSSHTVKPDAFVPHPYRALSVTRHRMATEVELWNVGAEVAREVEKTLYGRADIRALSCLSQRLRVDPDPTDSNPNHANVCEWPADKPAQKIIAMELAAATFLSRE
jgi:hypothetical protein